MSPGLITRRRASGPWPRGGGAFRSGQGRRAAPRPDRQLPRRRRLGPRRGVSPGRGGGADGGDGQGAGRRLRHLGRRQLLRGRRRQHRRSEMEDLVRGRLHRAVTANPLVCRPGQPRLPRQYPGPTGLRPGVQALEHARPLVRQSPDQRHQQGPGRRRPLRARHLPLHRRLPRRRREEGEGRRPAHGAAAKVARRRAGPVHRGLEGRRRPPPDLFGRRTWRARRLARTDGAAGPDPAAPSHPALPPRHEHDLQHIVRGATHYVCTGAGSLARKHCHGAGGDFCSVQSGFTACAASGDGLHVVEITRTA